MRLPFARFQKSQSGLAAVEFAFLLPVMITLFFGIVEVSQGLSARADVNNVASTTADLVAQESAVSSTDISNVFAAASAILYPNSLTDKSGKSILTVVISSVVDTGSTSSGKVAWSAASTGKSADAHSTGSTMSLPTGLMTSGGSVIVTEVTYVYTSATSQSITGPITMTSTFYTKPRRVQQIAGPTS
jgi:Flp pilus assembly protein TadG